MTTPRKTADETPEWQKPGYWENRPWQERLDEWGDLHDKNCACMSNDPDECDCETMSNLRDFIQKELDRERSLHSEALLENSKWQAMCEKFVGCSMLSDEFAGEPHEPESFGMYVENLLTQIKELEAKLAEAVQEEREACARVAEIEPELPGDMPDKMWEAVRNDRDACQESHKITVRGTKKNIAQAIRARSNLSRQSEKEK